MPEVEAAADIFPAVLIIGCAILLLGVAATIVMLSLNSSVARPFAPEPTSAEVELLRRIMTSGQPDAAGPVEDRLDHLNELRSRKLISAYELSVARAEVLRGA
ncbi:MAG: hypothetical protein JWQ43_2834 [Glaciihabitans sp.]|nr:hypothetical protein [Glaciihabitans sp.]